MKDNRTYTLKVIATPGSVHKIGKTYSGLTKAELERIKEREQKDHPKGYAFITEEE